MSSFKDAFKAARKEKGAGGTFTWNGKSYSTDYKEEVKSSKKKKSSDSTVSKSPRPKSRSSGSSDKPSVNSTAPSFGDNDTSGGSVKAKRKPAASVGRKDQKITPPKKAEPKAKSNGFKADYLKKKKA